MVVVDLRFLFMYTQINYNSSRVSPGSLTACFEIRERGELYLFVCQNDLSFCSNPCEWCIMSGWPLQLCMVCHMLPDNCWDASMLYKSFKAAGTSLHSALVEWAAYLHCQAVSPEFEPIHL
jgi:hypothetical protein